jgi:hypothetical protein
VLAAEAEAVEGEPPPPPEHGEQQLQRDAAWAVRPEGTSVHDLQFLQLAVMSVGGLDKALRLLRAADPAAFDREVAEGARRALNAATAARKGERQLPRHAMDVAREEAAAMDTSLQEILQRDAQEQRRALNERLREEALETVAQAKAHTAVAVAIVLGYTNPLPSR